MRGLTHSLFTPLQGAMADLENINLHLKDNEDLKEIFVRFRNNLESINNIGQQIQYLFSSEPEFSVKMLRKTIVHKMVKGIIDSVEPLAKEKYIDVTQGFNKFDLVVEAIPNQLKIVLTNIIQNAIKYSYSGFMDYHEKVIINYDSESMYLIIKVINLGVRIDTEEITDDKIFELGYRGIYSSDKNRKGTGTGLYISNQIVKRHGGEIKITSTPLNNNNDLIKNKNIFSIFWPVYYIEK